MCIPRKLRTFCDGTDESFAQLYRTTGNLAILIALKYFSMGGIAQAGQVHICKNEMPYQVPH